MRRSCKQRWPGNVLSGRIVVSLGRENVVTLAPIAILAALVVAATAHAEETQASQRGLPPIDSEHLFGFMIGTDVGEAGDREFEAETVGHVGKQSGSYQALFPALEYEWVPAENLRLSATATSAYHAIAGVPGLADRQQFALDALSFEIRYRLIDRAKSGFGLAVDAEPQVGRVDETTGEPAQQYAADLSLMIDRELVPDRILVALNLVYDPQLSRSHGAWSQAATAGTSAGLMAQIAPGILVGIEGRYLRSYEGLALDRLAGQALFIGPTLFARLTKRLWVISAVSPQLTGRAAGTRGSLDLVNFERYQAKVQFGLEF
jgi:hypothetical protein